MPLQTSPKRGRPARSLHEIAQVRFWAYQVECASQLTPAALDQRFAPAGEAGQGKPTCLWHKYRKGKACPKDEGPGDSTSLVARIDEAFPGTAYWYRHFFWDVAKRKVESMDELRGMFSLLSEGLRDQLVLKPNQRFEQPFWRSKVSAIDLYPALISNHTLDAGAAILALLKEGFIRQDYESYYQGKKAFSLWIRGLYHDPHLCELGRIYGSKAIDAMLAR